MISVMTENLVPGMIVARDVHSNNGSLLISKGMVLSEALITMLSSNYIFDVYVEEEVDISSEKVESSRSQLIKASEEFKQFKAKYEEFVDEIADSINELISKNGEEIDVNRVLKQPMALLEQAGKYSIFDMLGNMREYDDSTYHHCVNSALINAIIAKWMGYSEEDIKIATSCGLLHDIGKLRIPDEIIKKPGKLTEEEYKIIKNHPIEGYKVLDMYGDKFDENIRYAALEHHERFDGSGYPFKLKGEQINRFAMITAISDVYDAMTSARCYRGPICPFEVIDIMVEEGLEKYDTKMILTFLENMGNTYLHNRVRLSDGREGVIIFTDSKYPSKPMIQLDNGEFINLKDEEAKIVEIL